MIVVYCIKTIRLKSSGEMSPLSFSYGFNVSTASLGVPTVTRASTCVRLLSRGLTKVYLHNEIAAIPRAMSTREQCKTTMKNSRDVRPAAVELHLSDIILRN